MGATIRAARDVQVCEAGEGGEMALLEPIERYDGSLLGSSFVGARAVVRLARASAWFFFILSSYRLQRALVFLFGWSAFMSARLERRWERVHAANAHRFFVAASRLSGVYVKLGQVVSTLGTFLPGAYARELQKLQDRVPPRSFEVIDEAIFRAYGKPWPVMFAELSREPLAAASLGQVHRAKTHDGRDVAVKVLYPDIEATLKVDLVVVGWVLEVLKRFYPINDLDRLHRSMGEMLGRETDLRLEAQALRKMKRNFEGDASVALPEVDLALSNDRVLVMSFVDGVRITDRDGLARIGISAHDAARTLLDSFFRQVFVHRYFHADPHPGNFLVQRDEHGRPRIVLLDLGASATAKEHLVDGLMEVVSGLFQKNDRVVLAGVSRMGFLARDANHELVGRHIKETLGRLLRVDAGGMGQLDKGLVDRLAEGGPDKREAQALMRSVSYPDGWFELERSVAMLLGVLASEAPQLDPTQVAFPHIARWMAGRASRA